MRKKLVVVALVVVLLAGVGAYFATGAGHDPSVPRVYADRMDVYDALYKDMSWRFHSFGDVGVFDWRISELRYYEGVKMPSVGEELKEGVYNILCCKHPFRYTSNGKETLETLLIADPISKIAGGEYFSYSSVWEKDNKDIDVWLSVLASEHKGDYISLDAKYMGERIRIREEEHNKNLKGS